MRLLEVRSCWTQQACMPSVCRIEIHQWFQHLSGGAAFFAMREYEKHQAANGHPPSHAFAKELLAGIAAAEVSDTTASACCCNTLLCQLLLSSAKDSGKRSHCLLSAAALALARHATISKYELSWMDDWMGEYMHSLLQP